MPDHEVCLHHGRGEPRGGTMKILVTGITGFIGSELSKRLVRDHEVYGLVRPDSFEKTKLPTKVKRVDGDLLDEELGEKVAKVEPDAIVHLASFTPVRFSFEKSIEYGRTNYLGTVNLVEAARRLPSLRQFIHASTMEAYKDKQSTISEEDALEGGTPYGVSKAAADLYVQVAGKAWGLPFTILRPGNTFGRSFSLPEEARGYLVEKAVIGMLTQDKIEFDGTPDRVRSWLYYPDHVSAYISVLGNQNALKRVYNVVSEPRSVGDVVQIVADLTGFKGAILWGAKPRPYDPPMLMTTAEKIKYEVGWRPKYSVAEGLSKVVDYWRKKL
jgi:nucleoside-diphosphate-sugar epimerase